MAEALFGSKTTKSKPSSRYAVASFAALPAMRAPATAPAASFPEAAAAGEDGEPMITTSAPRRVSSAAACASGATPASTIVAATAAFAEPKPSGCGSLRDAFRILSASLLKGVSCCLRGFRGQVTGTGPRVEDNRRLDHGSCPGQGAAGCVSCGDSPSAPASPGGFRSLSTFVPFVLPTGRRLRGPSPT